LLKLIILQINFNVSQSRKNKIKIWKENFEESKTYSIFLGSNLEVTSFTNIFQQSIALSPWEWIHNYSTSLILSKIMNQEGKQMNLWEIILNLNVEVIKSPLVSKNFSGDFIYIGSNSLFKETHEHIVVPELLTIRIIYKPEFSSKKMKFILLIYQNFFKNIHKELN